MSGRRSRAASSAISSVARRVSITHAPPRLVPYSSAILIATGVISPCAPFSVAHPLIPSSPSRPAAAGYPGKTPSAAPHHAIYPTPRPTTSKTRRRNGTRGWRAVPDRCLAHRSSWSRCPVFALRNRCRPTAYRPQVFHLVLATIPVGIYPAPFSPAHLIRLGSSSHTVPRIAVPSGRADKQAAGGRQGKTRR